MKRIAFFVILTSITLACFGEVKYVFYMIGDGMGPNQVLLAETYTAALEGRIGRTPLRMTSFPYTGFATTYSASNGITDSAAGGTALASGQKTNNGCLGVDKDSVPVMSIAEELHNAGWPVGIMTSVAIDHATPGAFYAHVDKRNKYYQIGTQLAETEYEFFGGAGFHQPVNKDDVKAPNLYDYCEHKEYVFAHGYQDAQNKLNACKKMILIQQTDGIERTKGCDCLPYAIDRKKDDLTLPQITKTAIDFLAPREQFFMMIEGGKIDYACHSNDAATVIGEVLDFDAAIEVVYQFYLEHQDETLIVITADHETGGLALGNSDYTLNLTALQKQQQSLYAMGDTKEAKKKVEQINKEAKIGWTTGAHSDANVPVFAIGVGAELFTGWYDNTKIVEKIRDIIAQR